VAFFAGAISVSCARGVVESWSDGVMQKISDLS
jgi:hypothetical protein